MQEAGQPREEQVEALEIEAEPGKKRDANVELRLVQIKLAEEGQVKYYDVYAVSIEYMIYNSALETRICKDIGDGSFYDTKLA